MYSDDLLITLSMACQSAAMEMGDLGCHESFDMLIYPVHLGQRSSKKCINQRNEMLWEPIIQILIVPFPVHEWLYICVVTLIVNARCEDSCLFLFKQNQTNYFRADADDEM